MNAALSFYQLLATVSFTLLGLWFAVLSLDQRWRRDRARHRATLHITLMFFLPGAMGLGSVLSGGQSLMWRLFFVLGGLAGLVESVGFLRDPDHRHPDHRHPDHRPPDHRPPGPRALRGLAPWAYAAVVAAALVPSPVLGLAPLQVEGLATGLVFGTGMAHLWTALTRTREGVSDVPEAPLGRAR